MSDKVYKATIKFKMWRPYYPDTSQSPYVSPEYYETEKKKVGKIQTYTFGPFSSLASVKAKMTKEFKNYYPFASIYGDGLSSATIIETKFYEGEVTTVWEEI